MQTEMNFKKYCHENAKTIFISDPDEVAFLNREFDNTNTYEKYVKIPNSRRQIHVVKWKLPIKIDDRTIYYSIVDFFPGSKNVP
jgi:hypothetical protein